MPITDNLYRILQAGATLDQTKATAEDTRALAQMRQLGVLLQSQQAARDEIMRQKLMDSAGQQQPFNNQTSLPVLTGGAPAAGGQSDSDYDQNSPLMASVRSAQQGMDQAKYRVDLAQSAGDLKAWNAANNQYDNMQKEYRLAQMDLVKDVERRNKEAAQAFGMATTPEEVASALQYVNDNLGKRQSAAVTAQIAKALPGGLQNATPDQIQAAVAPITNRYASMGDQLRFQSSLQASQDRAAALQERARVADNKAANAQAGVPVEPLTEGGLQVASELSRKGLSLPGGNARGNQALRNATLNKMAADLEAEGQPYSAVTQERMDYKSRSAVLQDFSKGPTARNITSINTSLGHLSTLEDLGKALNNGDVQQVNKIANMVANQFGDPRINNAQTAAQAVGEEMMRTFRVVGASVTEAAKWEEKFKMAVQSPEQMEGVIKTGADLLRSRLEAVDDQWKRGMQTDKGYPDIISPKNQKFLESLGIKYNVTRSGEKATATAQSNVAPGGQGLAQSNPVFLGREGGDAEKQFKALPSGYYFQGPDGVTRRKP